MNGEFLESLVHVETPVGQQAKRWNPALLAHVALANHASAKLLVLATAAAAGIQCNSLITIRKGA